MFFWPSLSCCKGLTACSAALSHCFSSSGCVCVSMLLCYIAFGPLCCALFPSISFIRGMHLYCVMFMSVTAVKGVEKIKCVVVFFFYLYFFFCFLFLCCVCAVIMECSSSFSQV